MYDSDFDRESVFVINNEYDFSTAIPTVDLVLYLVEYCYNVYKQFCALVDEDEEKNKRFKSEYRSYMYKESFGTMFEVYIREKGFNNITCKSFETFKSAVDDGNLKSVNGVDIKFELDYKRGKEGSLADHENSFSIIFKPYEITFARKSNYNEDSMNEVENTIKDILSRCPSINSIFCTK